MKPFKLANLRTAYQPIVDTATGKIFAYEALTRGRREWSDPEKLFRHSYEEGYTVALDHACLKRAIQILPSLAPQQLLFVNIEPLTLGYFFHKWGNSHLKTLPAAHRRKLVFELTEGVKWADFKYLSGGVNYIRKIGCRFALDDVKGVGVKLFKLFTLKPDFIKIDMSLIKGLSRGSFSRSVVQHLLELSRKENSRVIAEGVENSRDLALVQRMHVHLIQGYYFAHPSTRLIKSVKVSR